MGNIRRDFLDGPHGQIHVRTSGSDQSEHLPLFLLHMFPLSSRSFVELMEAFPDDRLIVAIDLPGYGESTAPEDPIDASEYAATVWHVWEALSLGQKYRHVNLFGIHAGAKISVEAAYQKPDLVGRLALCSAAILTNDEVEEYRTALGLIPLDTQGTRFAKLWQMQARYHGDKVPLQTVAEAFSEMLRGGETYHWGHAAIFDYNEQFSRRLSTLELPISLINPADDLHSKTARTLPFIKRGQYLEMADWEVGFLQTQADAVADVLVRCFNLEMPLELSKQDNQIA